MSKCSYIMKHSLQTHEKIININKDLVIKAKKTIIPEQTSIRMADTFSVISDPTRIRILSALFEVELCVNELTQTITMSQSAISHQLRLLREHRLVKARKVGRMVYYSLDDDHIRHFIQIAKDHIDHGKN